MNDHDADLPIDPHLREIVRGINYVLEQIDPDDLGRMLDVARAVPNGQNECMRALEAAAFGDATLDERTTRARLAFVLMRAHNLGITCKRTGEAVAFCDGCGRMHVLK